MKNYGGKHERQGHALPGRSRAGRLAALITALVLCVLAAVGGTIAYLEERSAAVTNTFTVGDITYTLKLRANAAFVGREDGEVTMPSELAPSENGSASVDFTLDREPSLPGYTFAGWYADEDCVTEYTLVSGSIVTVEYGSEFDSDSAADRVTVTLYAKWTPNEYTIVYDANGGEGSMENTAASYGSDVTLRENTFTKDGAGFAGWNTAADGSGTSYADKATVRDLAQGGTVTLYAQWVAGNYTIRFDANGGEGSMADIEASFGETVALPANAFTRTGYAFAGWNTRSDGSGAPYADGASVSNLPSADGKTAILYAQWNELHTLTLNYDANGGEGAPEAQSVYADAEYSFDISDKIPTYVSPSGVAYEFLGWSESPDREAALQYSADGVNKEDALKPLAASVKVDYSEESASKTLYAVWGVTYRLSYSAGSGSGSVPQTVERFGRLTGCTFDVDYSVRPTWDEHEFKYWTTNVHYVTGEEKDKTVMYPEGSRITVSPEYSDETLFARYYNNGALTVQYNGNEPFYGVSYNIPENASIVAAVELDTVPYTISYAGEPTVRMKNKTKDYKLLGWSTSPNADEPEYTVGQQVLLSRYNDQNTELYAVWDVIPIITCLDIDDEEIVTSQKDYRTTEGYRWRDESVAWVPRAAEKDPYSYSAKFSCSGITGNKHSQTVIGFSDTKGGSDCNFLDLVNRETGEIESYGRAKEYKITEKLWNARIYDAERKAYFIPVHAVIEDYVRIRIALDFNNPQYTDSYSYFSAEDYLLSAVNDGTVKYSLVKNSSSMTSENFWLYSRQLRNGKEYRVIGWAFDPNSAIPDGEVIGSYTGKPPVYAESGNQITYVKYEENVVKDPRDSGFVKTMETYYYGNPVYSIKATTYTYILHIIYEKISDTNTFKVLLDYHDGVLVSADAPMEPVVTEETSYTYLPANLHRAYIADYSRCLDGNKYEFVGWSSDSATSNLVLKHYPKGHPENLYGSTADDLYTVVPIAVSTDDLYNEAENYYYKLFYAVYAKSLTFDGNYQGTVENMPDTLRAYTHKGFENDTAYIRIPDNIPTRSEALFLGWSTEKDGDVVYRPGDEVPVANANTTLYAVWQKSYQFTLSYDLNYEGAGVTTTLPYSNTVSYIEVNIISSDAAREGYTFLGWAETPDATEAAYSYPAQEGTSETIVLRATVPNETAAKTLYAVWKENAPEGGTQGDAVGTQSVNEAPAAPAPEPVQPEVPAEGEVKPSDTDKTEPPKAETPKAPE